MNNTHSRAYTDIMYILGAIDEKYVQQLPTELVKFFIANADHEYISKIDLSKPLTEQEISKETEQIICLLNLNYWCTTKEKQELLKKYKLNEQEVDKQLHDKYEIKYNKNLKVEDVKAIAVLKQESIFSKIIKFIKEIIIKKK